MKVAHVSQHYLPVIGGQEVYIDNLNRLLQAAGWTTEVYQPNRGIQRPDVVTVARIPGLPRLIYGADAYMFNAFLYLTKLGRLAEADVIIAHYAFSAWPLRRFAHRTIILSHGIEWRLENQRFDDRLREKVARRCLDEFFHVVNDTHYLRHFGYDISPASGFFTEVAPRKWFIPNCVDTARFQRSEGLPELKAHRTILVPRQIVRDRGIDLAIRAFKLLADEDHDLVLHVLGKIRHDSYSQLCLDLVRTLGLQGRVVFHDHIENGRMADYYSSARVTVIPTLRREGTSLSALESMACGTATVSTNVAGLRDLPTIQCDPEEHSLAQSIRSTLAEEKQIGERQALVVRNTFNFENWGKAWLKVIALVAETA